MSNEPPLDFQVLHEFIKKAHINLNRNICN